MGERYSRKHQNSQNQEKDLLVMYTNVDSLSNKMGDLNCFLKSLLFKPSVIAITEVNSKNSNTNLNINE